MMDAIAELFKQKTQEAERIVASKPKSVAASDEVPFEVNKVLAQISQETARRAKVLKRKPS